MKTQFWIQVGCQLTAIALGSQSLIWAQVVPDQTLPKGERSQFIGNDIKAKIDGGAIRGQNLFHSFSEFNVKEGQRIDFSNPSGIVNILNRVTGNDVSDIMGTLGVKGEANLFLLNPNGIIFGPNARLDVSGSFTASTANRLTFEDGGEFRAAPVGNELLSIGVPLGMQFNDAPNGSIRSTGSLVAGRDLVLSGGYLYLEGQVVAGRDVSLRATDTVEIRDTATEAFGAQAGRNLTIQGDQLVDIFTLNHPNSGLLSGGNLLLRSNNPVVGDAHFYSGGHWAVETLQDTVGSLLSPNDPIIFAKGDVALGFYIGASLHILAGGSVELGNIFIIDNFIIDNAGSINSTINPSNTALFNDSQRISDLATFNLTEAQAKFKPDGSFRTVEKVLVPVTINGNNQATVDVRAGVDWEALGGLPVNLIKNPTDFQFGPLPLLSADRPTRADIRVNGNIIIFESSGLVLLTNQFSPNSLDGTISILGSNIDTSASGPDSNGGDILIYGRGNIKIDNSRLDSQASSSLGNAGNAGKISVSTITGDISLLNSSSIISQSLANPDVDAGDGGDVALSTINGSIYMGGGLSYIRSESFAQGGADGAGGDISVITSGGNIHFNNTFLLAGDVGLGGTIAFRTQYGDILLEQSNLDSSSNSFGYSGDTKVGGDIAISTINGDIKLMDSEVRSSSSTYADNAVGGGNISFSTYNVSTAEGGDIYLKDTSLSSEILANLGNAGTGGDISLSTNRGRITLINSLSKSSVSSQKGNAGEGGNISFATISGDIRFMDSSSESSVYSYEGNVGSGGDISFSTNSGDIRFIDSDSTSFAFSYEGNAGAGGDISFSTNSGDIRFIDSDSTSSASSYDGSVGSGGDISFSTNSGDIRFVDSNATASVSSNEDVEGGDITIHNAKTVQLDNAKIRTSSEEGSSSAGDIAIRSSTRVSLFNSEINGTSNSFGDGGNIRFNTPRVTLDPKSTIAASTSASGAGGNIIFESPSPNLKISGNGELSVETSSEGNAGSFIIDASNLTIDEAKLTASTQDEGKGGDITIRNANLVQLDNAQLLTSSDGGSGVAGNIAINSSQRVFLNDSEINSNSNSIGRGGNIIFNTPNVSLDSESTVTASTSASGAGGNITFKSPDDNLKISGKGLLSVETNSEGNAGGFILDASNLTIDGAKLIASTQDEGEGGDIVIRNADLLQLDNAQLLTSSEGSTGPAGDINLENVGLLLMRRGSLIQAGANNLGSGGEVDIDADFVVTVPNEDNDILANAKFGAGGNIRIAANLILGFESVEQFRSNLRGNNRSEISASSEVGTQGTISLNTLSNDPTQDIETLSSDIIETDALIANSCIARRTGQGSFNVTSSGSLTSQPDEPRNPSFSTYELGPEHSPSEASLPTPDQAIGAARLEPDQVYHLANGEVLLGRSCR